MSCDGREIGGFPLRFDVICGKIDATDTATGLQAAMAGLRTAPLRVDALLRWAWRFAGMVTMPYSRSSRSLAGRRSAWLASTGWFLTSWISMLHSFTCKRPYRFNGCTRSRARRTIAFAVLPLTPVNLFC